MSVNPHTAAYRLILAALDDHQAVVVLADWLGENGDAEGEATVRAASGGADLETALVLLARHGNSGERGLARKARGAVRDLGRAIYGASRFFPEREKWSWNGADVVMNWEDVNIDRHVWTQAGCRKLAAAALGRGPEQLVPATLLAPVLALRGKIEAILRDEEESTGP